MIARFRAAEDRRAVRHDDVDAQVEEVEALVRHTMPSQAPFDRIRSRSAAKVKPWRPALTFACGRRTQDVLASTTGSHKVLRAAKVKPLATSLGKVRMSVMSSAQVTSRDALPLSRLRKKVTRHRRVG